MNLRTRTAGRAALAPWLVAASLWIAVATAYAQTTDFYGVANNATSTLSAGIDADDTTIQIPLADAEKFPAGKHRLVLSNKEIVTVASRSGNTFTLSERGSEGSTAASHLAGGSVKLTATAGFYTQITEAINALEEVQAGVVDVPTMGSEDAISSGWAYAHTQSAHVPTDDTAEGQLIGTDGAHTFSWKTPKTKAIVLSATGGTPATTDGCDTVVKVQMSDAEHVDLWSLDFADGQFAGWSFILPDDFVSGSTLTAKVYWTGAEAGSVTWVLNARSYADEDSFALDMDANPATTGSVSIASANLNRMTDTTAPLTLNCSVTAQAGQPCFVRLTRSGGTLPKAKLLWVKLEYSAKAY